MTNITIVCNSMRSKTDAFVETGLGWEQQRKDGNLTYRPCFDLVCVLTTFSV